MNDILSALRIVDLSMGWAGPLAARHLADMGAEVIKVEPPIMGDPGRLIGTQKNGLSAFFTIAIGASGRWRLI